MRSRPAAFASYSASSAAAMVVAIVAPRARSGQPDRQRHLETRGLGLPPVRVARALQALDDPASGREVRAGEHDEELVAAVAHGQVVLAAVVADDAGDATQHGVADRVRERVVDALEPVDVDEHDRQRQSR